jgi:hypothetical protein
MKQINYDLIGDIHGQAPELIRLLKKLSYRQFNGVWQHTDRKVIFLGDFIDRGNYQKAVINIVRPMVEQGFALSVMGNHEYNAIAYFTKNSNGEFLRPHNQKNLNQHKEFINAYSDDSAEYERVIKWFKTLPLWIDFDNFRVVHACWDNESINLIKDFQNGSSILSDKLLCESIKQDTWQHNAIEILIKGKKVLMPNECAFDDADNNIRKKMRVKWWKGSNSNYQDCFIGPDKVKALLPLTAIGSHNLTDYRSSEKLLFIGHYWLNNEITPLTDNIVCLDYSVAKKGGELVAYRWNGESVIDINKFVSVERL